MIESATILFCAWIVSQEFGKGAAGTFLCSVTFEAAAEKAHRRRWLGGWGLTASQGTFILARGSGWEQHSRGLWAGVLSGGSACNRTSSQRLIAAVPTANRAARPSRCKYSSEQGAGRVTFHDSLASHRITPTALSGGLSTKSQATQIQEEG